MKKESGNNTSSGGLGFVGLLQVVFITLKLCNVIDWSWVWVLAPFWGSTALVLLIFIILVIAAVANDK